MNSVFNIKIHKEYSLDKVKNGYKPPSFLVTCAIIKGEMMSKPRMEQGTVAFCHKFCCNYLIFNHVHALL